MANIAEWLKKEEQYTGEIILAMVVGPHDRDYRGENVTADTNTVVSRELGLAMVDEEYDNGHGSADCHPIYAWTKSRVYMIHEYDGATGPMWVPRNPMDITPEFGGQPA